MIIITRLAGLSKNTSYDKIHTYESECDDMKRLLAMTIALVMALSLAGCGAGNKNDPTETTGDSACRHVTQIKETVNATCTQTGYMVTECSLCGEKFRETIPSTSHNYTDATCGEPKTCAVCGITEGDPLGHTYADGLCVHCGEKMPGFGDTDDCSHVCEKTGHIAPTCTEDGSYTYSCTKCDFSYVQIIPSPGHHIVEASCEKPKACTLCGEAFEDSLGHRYEKGTCIRCGKADPSTPKEVTYTVTVRSDKGSAIEGVIVSVYTGGDTPAASGTTNHKGVATMTLLAADSYTITLSRIPPGFAAKESYSFTSTAVNINLSTLSIIDPTDHSKANYKVGGNIGDFTLTDTDGETYALSKLLKDKDLVILNFWFVNCGPCKSEFPHFEEVSQSYENIQLLTLNPIDNVSAIRNFKDQNGYSFPMISDHIGLSAGFNVSAYPTTVFIDSSGRIIAIDVGAYPSQQALENRINSLLK